MLLAYPVPGLSLLKRRRPKLGILFLLLQFTIINWVIEIFIAARNEKRQHTRRRIKLNKR
jgi:hypothetical protein